MDAALQELLLDRLAIDPPKAPGAEDLVLAALLGNDELDSALAEGTAREKPSRGPVSIPSVPRAPAYARDEEAIPVGRKLAVR